MRLQGGGVDHQPLGHAALGRQAREDAFEHAEPAPSHEPVVQRLVWAVTGRRVLPLEAVADDVMREEIVERVGADLVLGRLDRAGGVGRHQLG